MKVYFGWFVFLSEIPRFGRLVFGSLSEVDPDRANLFLFFEFCLVSVTRKIRMLAIGRGEDKALDHRVY